MHCARPCKCSVKPLGNKGRSASGRTQGGRGERQLWRRSELLIKTRHILLSKALNTLKVKR